MMNKNRWLVMSSLAFLGTGCGLYGPPGTSSTVIEFQATLTGDAERPTPVVTDAVGTGTFSLNNAETELSYSVSVSGLSGEVTAAHFHFAVDGAAGSGPPIFTITSSVINDGMGGATADGIWNLTEEDVRNLRLDYIYVNFHTAANIPGEIRGNLVPAP